MNNTNDFNQTNLVMGIENVSVTKGFKEEKIIARLMFWYVS